MRVIIAGGRTFTNLDFMIEQLDPLFIGAEAVTIISGTCRGADQTGEQYAALRDYPVERHPAQWDVYGRSAGYKRNAHMAEIATHCIVFWDGESKGSKHMIDLATTKGLDTRVIRYKGYGHEADL